MNVGIAFCRFSEALGIVFLIFRALKTDLKIEGIFGDVTDPEFWNWRGGSTTHLTLQNR